MKKQFTAAYSVFLASVLLFAASCNTPEKMISRLWKVKDAKFDERVNSFPPELQKTMMKQLTTNFYFRLSRDSVYQTINGNDVVNGKWWLLDKGKKLHTENGGMGPIESDIISLSKTELVFESPNSNNEKMRFFCVAVDSIYKK